LLNTVVLVNAIVFAAYGCDAIFSNRMVDEFDRYGLSKFRVLVGVLQVFGAAGEAIGIFFNPLLVVSSACLSLLMLLGVTTRIRINDPLLLVLPAFVLMILNAAICAASLHYIEIPEAINL